MTTNPEKAGGEHGSDRVQLHPGMNASSAIEALDQHLVEVKFAVDRDAALEGALLVARRAKWKLGMAHIHTSSLLSASTT